MKKRQMTILVSDNLRDQIKKEAEKLGLSKSRWVEYAIKSIIDGRAEINRFPSEKIALWSNNVKAIKEEVK